MLDRKSFGLLAAGLGIGAIAAAAWSQGSASPSKAYVVGEMTVKDMTGYRAYGDLAEPIIRKYGGTFLVRGGQTVAVEGATPGRIVIIEFPSLEQAKAFEYSKDYQAIEPMRQKAADSRLYLAEGTVAAP